MIQTMKIIKKPYIPLTRVHHEDEKQEISKNLVNKIRSCKIIKKLRNLSELNLKENASFIRNSEQEGIDNYNVYFTSEINKDIFQSPIDYLIKKGIAKERDKPFRIRYAESGAFTKTLKVVRLDLKTHQAIAYINFNLKE